MLVAFDSCDHGRVPVAVQINRITTPARQYTLVVAARIMFIGRMQGLMNVAHEMKKEFESKKTLSLTRTGTFQFRRELGDLIDDAIVCWACARDAAGRNWWMTETSIIDVRALDFNIDEVPLAGCRPPRCG
jgi:hypothetical protein